MGERQIATLATLGKERDCSQSISSHIGFVKLLLTFNPGTTLTGFRTTRAPGLGLPVGVLSYGLVPTLPNFF